MKKNLLFLIVLLSFVFVYSGKSEAGNKVSKSLEIASAVGDTIAKINFTLYNEAHDWWPTGIGWTNVSPDPGHSGKEYGLPANCGGGVALSIDAAGGELYGGVNGPKINLYSTGVVDTYAMIKTTESKPVVLKISGLSSSKKYLFSFFGSRSNATQGGRKTTFKIGDDSQTVDTYGNVSDVLYFHKVVPNASGEVEITITKESGQYGHINAMIITEESPNGTTMVSISSTDANATEAGQSPGIFTISRTTTSGSLTVNYAITGTASPDDYTPTLTGSITIAGGSLTKTITITPVDDAIAENHETVILTLTSGDGYMVGSPSKATVTIVDNDQAPGPIDDINVIFSHSFGNNTLGAYSRAEIDADWKNPSSGTLNISRSFIVMDTIVGVPTKVLHWEYPKGSLSPTYGGGQWETAAGAIYEEIYFSYDIKFKPGFNFQLGGKIPGLKGAPDVTKAPTWSQGFTASMMFTKTGKINFYSYNQAGASQSYSWGENTRFTPGQWHNITYRVVMNTIGSSGGNKDGILEGFFDGKLVCAYTNICFRNLSTIGVDYMKIYSFFGGDSDDWRNTKDEWVHLDNFMLYTFKPGISGVPYGNNASASGRTIPYFGRMQNAGGVLTENTHYNLTIQKTGNGTVCPAPGTYEYLTTSLPNLIAVPDFGWQFDGWSNGVVSPNTDTGYKRPFTGVTSINDKTFALMTSDKIITATFSQAPSQADFPKTIAQINFTSDASLIETDWVNVRGDYPYPVYLGYGIYMEKGGSILGLGEKGEASTIFTTNVGKTYNFVQNTDTEPVVFTLSGLDPSRKFSFDFFCSRDDGGGSGNRQVSFTIGQTTVSQNAYGNTGTLSTINDVSPSASGEITINMTKPANGYAYLNAMIVRRGSSTSITNLADQSGEIKIFPNPVVDDLFVTGLSENVLISVYDMTGRKVKEYKDNSFPNEKISLQDLKNGM